MYKYLQKTTGKKFFALTGPDTTNNTVTVQYVEEGEHMVKIEEQALPVADLELLEGPEA